jgi:tyrosinase
MKLLSLLYGLSLFSHVAYSHPLDLPFTPSEDDINELGKRQSTVVPVTGVGGAVQPRLEIRQMQSQKPNQFTLLLLALQQMHARAQTSATSYYQISGIHGVPRQDYNGVGQCSTCAGSDGYCTHDSVLFPAWHRAYIALFEQEFMKIVNNIANTWPTSGSATTRATMKNAASTMRWPYWDWAAAPPNGGNMMPNTVSAATIIVNGPTGQQTISNPLFRHVFTDSSSLVYTPFKAWQNTLRYPTSDSADATSNNAQCVANLNTVRATLKDQIYQLFSTCTDYLHFSNDRAGSSTTSCSNSLEGIHNTIHTTVGGVPSTDVKTVGHMYYLAEAAFDPIFWLHHTNVDRIFAMWQTINPNSYGASQTAPHNTWTIAKGTTQNADSPLTPFYKDSSASSFWTTNEVKDWTVFSYTYPEFVDSDGSKAAMQSYVQKLYGPSATATAGSSKRTAGPEPVASPAAAASTERDVPVNILALQAPNGSTYEYIANIQTPRYALGGSYYVFLFLGDPASEDPTTWMSDDHLIGPMGVLAQDTMKGADVMVAGSIPITRTLTGKLKSGLLGQLTESVVAPFLENALKWRILGPEGTSVDPDDVEGFEVAVYASTATTPADAYCLPNYSKFIPLTSVTRGKKGGAGRGQSSSWRA